MSDFNQAQIKRANRILNNLRSSRASSVSIEELERRRCDLEGELEDTINLLATSDAPEDVEEDVADLTEIQVNAVHVDGKDKGTELPEVNIDYPNEKSLYEEHLDEGGIVDDPVTNVHESPTAGANASEITPSMYDRVNVSHRLSGVFKPPRMLGTVAAVATEAILNEKGPKVAI